MTLTLDKGLATERSLTLDTVSERPLTRTLNGTRMVVLEDGAPFPAADDFGETRNFETVSIESEKKEFPISGKYNVIVDYSVQYNEQNRRFSVSVALGWEADDER